MEDLDGHRRIFALSLLFYGIEEPYEPHRIVGAIDHNPADGVMIIDEKK